jgi:hypothetical protein
MSTLREHIPSFLRRHLPAFFDADAPVETKATCDRCVMCAPPGEARSHTRDYFRPDIKCCTYHPTMPNFLVGAILSDEGADLEIGRARVRQLIAQKTGVTPKAVGPSRKYQVLMQAGRYHAFGRSHDLRCPYFQVEEGRCSVWRYRKSDCAVFYCKYDAAADGQAFWRGFGGYWQLLENRLALLVMKRVSDRVEEPHRPYDRLSVEELEDRPPNPDDYRRWWGPYEGREEEFYRACYRAALSLSLEEARELLEDDDGKKRLRMVGEAYQQLRAPVFPAKLEMNPELTEVPGPEGTTLVVGYSRYEPMALPAIIYRLLREFDGESTVAEVQRRILEKEGADFADGLVLTMFQHRILVDADAPESG